MPRTYVYTQYGGPETEAFMDMPKPEPGPGQLLVSVRAAGVNPADWKQRAGLRATEPLPAPVGMGREAAGVVEELGEGVAGFSVGDEVFGTVIGGGGFAEYAVFGVEAAADKPASMSFLDAATLPVAAATAYDGIQHLGLKAGQTLLIIGAGGGVGIATAQIAKGLGIRVIGTASEAKKELVESVGATHVTYGPGELDRVRAAAPDGIDGLYDQVGGEPLRTLSALVEDKSKVITAADTATVTEIGGSQVIRTRNAATMDEVAKLVQNGTLKPFVTQVFPLDKVNEAMRLVEDGHATGKVVIEVN